MRPELEEIKYIEDYLINNLTEEQKEEFEKRLKNDPEFAHKVKLQRALTKRVTRLSLKHSVAQAHRRHTQRNTFMFKRRPNKNFFRSLFTLSMILVVGYLIFTSNNEQPDKEKNHIKTGDTVEIVPKHTNDTLNHPDTLKPD